MIKRFQELKKVRRSLIEHVEMLNKASKDSKYYDGIPVSTEKTLECYRALRFPILLVLATFLLNFSFYFIVFFYKRSSRRSRRGA